MHPLIKRLRYLRSREALAAAVLPSVIVWKWWKIEGDITWSLRLGALSLLVYILVQGTLYWHLKLRSIERQTPLPAYFRQLFRAFKWSNLIGMVSLALLLLARDAVTDADTGWTIGLLIGAALEQVNYYHYQLMYDTWSSLQHLRRNGQLRKAALATDLARS